MGQAAGFLRHLVSLSPLAGFLALAGYNYWIDSVFEKYQKHRIFIYSLIIFVLTFLFLSKELVIHHIVGNEPEYIKLINILVLTFIFAIAAYISNYNL